MKDSNCHFALFAIDHLTLLPNRTSLVNALVHLEKGYKESFQALFLLDLDHFRTINHTQGHTMGDRILLELTQKLKQFGVEVYRSGGDEFAILYETNLCKESLAKDASLLFAQSLLNTVSTPLYIAPKTFHLRASIGVILFKHHTYSAEQLFQYADSALFCAKEEGKNRIRFFQADFQKKMESNAIFLEQLQYAIDNDQMELYYQKQVRLTQEQVAYICGAEALIRWHHPHSGMVPPNQFIPIAEESGLIIPLGYWILEHAMKQLKQWESDPIKKAWHLSINISAKQFEHDDFLPMLHTLLKCITCNPQKIQFELTESLLIQDAKKALRKIFELKRLGIALSIDDFGTGFSSLSYLRRLKVDELKIDKSFVRRMLTSPVDFTIVEMILTLGRRFHLNIIAEGIETQAQYEALKHLGCHFFQGYFFHKPCPEHALI
jgi:diguanylate cyclase